MNSDNNISIASFLFISTAIITHKYQWYNCNKSNSSNDLENKLLIQYFNHCSNKNTIILNKNILHQLHSPIHKFSLYCYTDIIINAILKNDKHYSSYKCITAKSFSVDNFLSIWVALNPRLGIKYSKIISQSANLSQSYEFYVDSDSKLNDIALRIVCWINAMEKQCKNTVISDCEEEVTIKKINHLLDHFSFALQHIQSKVVLQVYQSEYKRIVDECNYLRNGRHKTKRRGSRGNGNSSFKFVANAILSPSYTKYPSIGLIAVRAHSPLHQYSLFSLTADCTAILASYSGNRYELQYKYPFSHESNIRCRLPRVDFTALVSYLNAAEKKIRRKQHRKPSISEGEDSGLSDSTDTEHSCDSPLSVSCVPAEHATYWYCDPITHERPVLRLKSQSLSKQESNILPSAIPSDTIVAIIISYLEFAYQSANIDSRDYWQYDEVLKFNRNLQWSDWQPPKIIQ